MIFWIPLFVLLFTLVTAVVLLINKKKIAAIVASVIALILLISVLNMGWKIFQAYANIDPFVASALQRQAMLDYEVKEGIYQDDFNINEKVFLDDIQYWNCDLAERHARCHNFWYGIFYPDVYDQFHYIDYTKINSGTIKTNATNQEI